MVNTMSRGDIGPFDESTVFNQLTHRDHPDQPGLTVDFRNRLMIT